MTPQQWNELLAPTNSWKECYKEVARIVLAHLKANPLLEGQLVGTNELVEQLYPVRYARGDGIEARRRLYKALFACSEYDLKDCFTRGAEKEIGKTGRMGREFLWHAPPAKLCPHCGGEL